jgi:alkanesulfonate monooxygenase SsuD/methylene tetrahydromethanopterin reductase-like flavin-dependent oxidoreductase (luciferase family)
MAAVGRRPSFGVKTRQMGLTYDQILTTWRQADRMTVFEHVWLWDHMVPLRGDIRGATLEGWTLLGALAAHTSQLRRPVAAPHGCGVRAEAGPATPPRRS